MVSSASVFSTAKWLEAQSLLFKAVAVLFGSLILTAGSYITVPMVPVPITMQTFAITVVGAVYGWRLGGLTVLFWRSRSSGFRSGCGRRYRPLLRPDWRLPLLLPDLHHAHRLDG